eukprot:GDKJ01011472.1.p1 GENE.GDKJ01011472.1~~GDKJ01011472.1.p1  ORF type:complete len:318 (+),score=74.05 GDKJ01011472.1:125-955(+)
MEYIKRQEKEIGVDMERVLKEIEDYEQKSLKSEMMRSNFMLPSKYSTGDKKMDELQLLALDLGMPLLPLANGELVDIQDVLSCSSGTASCRTLPELSDAPGLAASSNEDELEDEIPEEIQLKNAVEQKDAALVRLLSTKPTEDPAIANIAEELEEAAIIADKMLKKCEETYNEMKALYAKRRQSREDQLIEAIEARGGAEALMNHPSVNWKDSEERLNNLLNNVSSSQKSNPSLPTPPISRSESSSRMKNPRRTGGSVTLPELDLSEDMISKLMSL